MDSIYIKSVKAIVRCLWWVGVVVGGDPRTPTEGNRSDLVKNKSRRICIDSEALLISGPRA